MAINRKTINFLPSIFQTTTNKKFLGSTLDQLVSEPDLIKINGFIGRKFSPTYKKTDGYLTEPTQAREYYQLEPSVVIRNSSGKITQYIDYNDFINKISYYGGNSENHDRLFRSEFYSYDPKIDLDKLVNYNQYYWIPSGPSAVPIKSLPIGEPDSGANLIAVFGDSVSTYGGLDFIPGTNPSLDSSYNPNQAGSITSTIQSLYPAYYVVNISRGGMTTDEALTGVQTYVGPGLTNPFGSSSTITQWIIDNKPAKIVLRYGLADAILKTNSASTIANIETIVNFARNRNIEVILIGVNPTAVDGTSANCNYKTPPSMTLAMSSRADAINDAIINIAQKNGFRYANVRNLRAGACSFFDGIHPFTNFGIDISNEIYDQLNTTIYLARGKTYRFTVNGSGNVWIQTEPGINGAKRYNTNVSSRNIFGVTNNGEDSGVITFAVPLATAQDSLIKMPFFDYVDYATNVTFTSLDGSLWTRNVSAIDGELTWPNNRYIVFLTTSNATGDWTDRNSNLVPLAQRRGIWKIKVNHLSRLELTYVRDIPNGYKFEIRQGNTKKGLQYEKNSLNFFAVLPDITAPLETLYFQNENFPLRISKISIVDKVTNRINVTNDILGKKYYVTDDGVRLTNGMKIEFDNSVIPSSYRNKQFIVEGIGRDIRLVDFEALVAPEIEIDSSSIPFDIGNFDMDEFDGIVKGSIVPDYITINRSSVDYNAWSRSNRWFHADVVQVSAQYLGITADLSQYLRAQRPIIEFIPDLQLFNHGRIGLGYTDKFFDSQQKLIQTANVVDLDDALQQVQGIDYKELSKQGLEIKVGQRIIFANDSNNTVAKTIYTAGIVDLSTATTPFDGLLTGIFTARLGTKLVSALGGKFNSELTVGSHLYDNGNIFVGVVEKINNDNELILSNAIQYEYAGSPSNANWKYNNAKVNLVASSTAAQWHNVVVLSGTNNKKSYFYTGSDWTLGQIKNSINQEPLFDIVNAADISLSVAFTGSEFVGSKLFSYTRGSLVADTYLGFSLSYYNTTGGIGDIKFTNNYDNDSFQYLSDVLLNIKSTVQVNTGFIRQITGFTTHKKLNVWHSIIDPSLQYQHISAEFDGRTSYFEIGCEPYYFEYHTPAIKVAINNKQIIRSKTPKKFNTITGTKLSTTVIGGAAVADRIDNFYQTSLGRHADQAGLDYWTAAVITGSLTIYDAEMYIMGSNEAYMIDCGFMYQKIGVRHTIKINPDLLSVGDRIDIFVYSRQTARLGNYQIPVNLELNPQNLDVYNLSLGQLRLHLQTIGLNYRELRGNPESDSNIRDLDTATRGGTILQHSSSLIYAATFLTGNDINFVNSVDYARREYTRFKNKFLELAVTLTDISTTNIVDSVDKILVNINQVKNKSFPWYYSDMIPYGKNYITNRYTLITLAVTTFNLTKSYKDLSANAVGILVYKNGVQLIKNIHYVFNASPTLTFSSAASLAIGDIIEIREYSDTDGCYVPETPTKLGLYPKYIPAVYQDNTYRTAINVIQGHDGSIIPAFNDYRDDLLLELEKRIYNNIKVEYQDNLIDINSIVPGKYRDTDYSLKEFNDILNSEFLKWVGYNQLDFGSNLFFLGNDEYSWNYSRAVDNDNETLPGFWRAIYKWYFDTDRPHTHPWEMMGYTIKPVWWDTHYSWTNSVKRSTLIFNITNGFVYDPGGPNATKSNPVYARAGFSSVVPVDTSGNLISPARAVARKFNSSTFSAPFAIGDQGPVESAWRRSSEFPYAMQRAIALAKPANYFGRLFDTSRFYYDSSLLNQYVSRVDLKRISSSDIVINGESVNDKITRAAGYINWIHGYLTGLGKDAALTLRNQINNISVNLSHRLAGFTDKKFINVITEQISPTSLNESVIVPDENYVVHLNKSTPVVRVMYSAVIVERTQNGYTVSGYDLKFPYFTVIPSEPTGDASQLKVYDTTVVVFEDFKSEKITVPYGYEFGNRQQVVDFLISYERFLLAQGFTFDRYNNDLALVNDWRLSIREFLSWAAQGWSSGNIIVLSPVCDQIDFISTDGIIDTITNKLSESRVLGLNFNLIKTNELIVVRDNNLTTINTISGQTIGFVELNLVQFEHALIFDNLTVFNNIIYQPDTAARQYRLRLVGSMTANWDGQLTPSGFVYSSGEVAEWQAGRDYFKGEIVKYKDNNYTAILNLTGQDSFNINYWSVLDTELTEGLSTNFSHNAQELVNVYDLDDPSASEDLAAFGSGLIGFKNRSWFDNLGISTISQTKFYQGYIKEKGTKNAIDALAKADLQGISNTIDIYEEWGARIGSFGALDLNPYITVQLVDTTFKDNPIGIELLAQNQSTSSDSTVAGIKASRLLNKPLDYTSNIFLERNPRFAVSLRIELFGDSIMCGKDSGIASGNSLLNYLTCRYDQTTGRVTMPPDYLLYQGLSGKSTTNYNLSVITRSVENSTSGRLLAGTDGVNGPWPDNIDADLVIINHGMVDAKEGVSPVAYKNNLIALRNALKSDQGCIWLTPAPVNRNSINTAWGPIGTNDMSLYANAMKEVALIYGDLVADTHTMVNWLNYLTSDGVHPTQNGYTRLVNDLLIPVVEQYVRNKQLNSLRTFVNDVKSAGYVHVDDVDSYLFDINYYNNLNDTILKSLVTGYKIWVARDFKQDWQVYRVYKTSNTVTSIAADLDRKVIATTIKNHNLAVEDIFVIRGFNSTVDGFYQALSTTANTITFVTSQKVYDQVVYGSLISNTANLFDLQPLRFANIKLRDTTVPKHGWLTSDLSWIDDSGDAYASWAVYKKLPTYSISANVTTVVNNSAVSFTMTSAEPNEELYYSIENAGSGVDTIDRQVQWKIFRQQQESVDIDSISNVYLFSDKNKQIITKLDILDPIKGRILGTAGQDIDYTLSIDPAKYSTVSTDYEYLPENINYYWASDQIGKYWWNIDRCRLIEYEQDTLRYRLDNWGRFFPGSEIHVYEWISSDLLPSQHVAAGLPGKPLYANDEAYSVGNYIDPSTNAITVKYYYWLRGHSSKFLKSKTHTASTLEDIIANPKNQDIPYMAAIATNSFGLYNIEKYLNSDDTVLYLSYKTALNEKIIHSDMQLVQQGFAASVIPQKIESKLIDSICQTNYYFRNGYMRLQDVPDNSLSLNERFGTAIRPRQSVIVDPTKARENLIKYVNFIFKLHPVASKITNIQNSYLDNFFAFDPVPTNYQALVDSYSQLSAPVVQIGGTILVVNDETQGGYWTLYEKISAAPAKFELIQKQNFDVTKYWSYADWYVEGYDIGSIPDFTVDQYKDIYKLDIVSGNTVKVLNKFVSNAAASGSYTAATYTSNNFSLYQFDDDLRPKLIGLGNGTLELSSQLYQSQGFDSNDFDSLDFDKHYLIELRYILKGLKEDIFVDELLQEYNLLMFYLIEYILTEQKYFDWFMKTSFVKIVHKIKGLNELPIFLKNRQEQFEKYISEVKPYRTKIRDYTLSYDQLEKPLMTVTDFDLPGYYDKTLKVYRSPSGEYPSLDANVLLRPEYRDWVNNHKYYVDSLEIAFDGYGYYTRPGYSNSILADPARPVIKADLLADPVVSITRIDGGIGSNARAKAIVDTALGSVNKVYVEDTGSNYTVTPLVSVHGNGAEPVSDRRVFFYQVVGTGYSNTAGPRSFGLYDLQAGTALYTTALRGYTMHRIRRKDGTIVFTKRYDLLDTSNPKAAGDLANDLNLTNNDYIVVVYSYDEPQTNRLTQGLFEAMLRCGASREVFGSIVNFKYRSAYVLVGIPGIGAASGIEAYSGSSDNSATAYASVSFKIRQGVLVPIASVPKQPDFAVGFSLPTGKLVIGQSYSYGARTWVYTGYRWSQILGQIKGTIPEKNPPHYAVLSPRLKNNAVRKLRTTIRFDRISYTSDVIDWSDGGFDSANFDSVKYDLSIPANSYFSYEGRAYYTTQTLSIGIPVNLKNAMVVGSNQPVVSRNYRDGFFDNANDRIMGYYKPTPTMTPKDLARLVPGIGPISNTNLANLVITPDTVLIGDTFTNIGGIPSSNIKINGGNFIEAIFNYSPEELVPGVTLETLSIMVITSNVAGNVGFRLWQNIDSNVANVFYTVNPNNTTSLAQPLMLSDGNVFVNDGTKLSVPDPLNIVPGIIYVNGERILYYVKDGNRLGQIRRSYGGTGVPLVHPIGAVVYNMGPDAVLPPLSIPA